MKKHLTSIIIIFTWFHSFAQEIPNTQKQIENKSVFNAASGQFQNYEYLNTQSEIDQTLADLDFNCNEDFWTINESGEIQQWNLINDVVSGGDIILTSGSSGIALSGDLNNPIFYCSNSPSTGITYYDSQNGWISIPTTDPLLNNGGYENDQYYMGSVFDPDLGFHVSRILYHFDGTSLEIIEMLESDFFTVADIAVDGLGRAWVFKGDSLGSVTSLDVYNSTGIVMSFNILFDSLGSYGSFFLNDILYIGMGNNIQGVSPNSIIPIIISDGNAEIGTPISFPDNQPSYFDMASCHNSNPLSLNGIDNYKNEFMIFPNPTQNIINLPNYIDVINVDVMNLNGQILKTIEKSDIINLANLPSGIYILKIITKNGTVNKRVIKE